MHAEVSLHRVTQKQLLYLRVVWCICNYS